MANKGISFKITAVNKTKQAFGSITSGLKKVGGAVFSLKSALTGVVGIGAMGLLIKSSLTATDRLGKMSNVLGIAVKDLQTLKLASEIGGIEFETFGKATRRLVDNFGDFLNGTGEATATFKALGISVADANALSGDQMAILGLVADKLDQVQNSTLKLKFAQELFGGRGAELINVLKGGSEALQKFAEESEKYGSLNNQQVKAVEDFNDSLVRMKTAMMNIVNVIVANLSPVFKSLSEDLREFTLNQTGDIQNFGKVFALSMIDATESLILFGQNVAIAGGNLRTFFENVYDLLDFSKFFQNFDKSFKPFESFTYEIAPAMEKVLNTIRERVTALSGAVDENNSALKGTDKTAKDLIKNYSKMETTIKNLEDSSVKMGTSIAGSFEKAVFEGGKFSDTLKQIGQDIIKIAYQSAITKPLGGMLGDFIGGIFSTVGGAVTGTPIPGKRAMGGAVTSGQSYMVGERGAELFTPNSSGRITPNNKMGQDSIKIVQQINIMPSVSEVARAEIFGMLPLIKQEALNGVMDARNRGGSFARAMGVKA